jgi:uncharacterized protein
MNQQQLRKNNIICGIIVSNLLWSCALPLQSAPPPTSKAPIQKSQPSAQPTGKGQKLALSAQLTIGRQNILMEVARTDQEQSIGLMYRTELADNRGMLFVFNPPRPASFWMKNTLIPLDMLFLSRGVIKYIGTEILPCAGDPCPGYGPDQKTEIDSVIELRGGRAAELKLKVGDRLTIRQLSAKRLKQI